MAGEEFKVSLGVELRSGELDNIRNQINGIQVNPINLQINTRNVQNQINAIRRQIQSLSNIRINLNGGNGGGNGGGVQRQANDALRAYRELASLQNRLSSKMTALDKLDTLDTSRSQQEIVELTTQINNLYARYQNLYNLFSHQLSPIQTDSLNRGFEVLSEKLNIINSQLRDTNANLVNTINANFDNGTFANDLSKIDASLAKIRTQSSDVINGMQQLNTALSDMQTARANGDMVALIASYERYEDALKNVQKQIEINTRAEKQQNDIAKLNDDRIAFASKIDIWLSKNSAATKQFGAEIDALKARLQNCDRVELDHLKAEFTDIQKRAEMAGKATMTFGDRFNMQMKRLSSYFSAATLIAYSARAITDMYDNVVAVDTAMTGLYRVTDLTAQQYDELYDNMIASAKEYGSTLTDIINSTADWVRLGFDTSTANRLTEITAMYQHISDLDNSTAVENLVTAYKGFQDQLLNLYNGDEAAAIEYIADILNELDNNFAVTADDIGAALTKSASALELAGNTIQETAAMVTGITEVTQDPEKAGSALKILSLRLRGMKGELEELGEEVDENVESISKMQTQVLNFTSGKVNIFNDDGSFKSTYEIMDAIADVYDRLSSTDQADLLETIAGKNRANDVAALLSNWKQVEAAMQSAMEAEGSAAIENEKYMESIQGRLDALTATWQALSNTVINSDFVKVLITGLTEILNLLDGIVNTLGSFGTIGAGVAIFNIFKNKDLIRNVVSLSKALFDSKTTFDQLMTSSDNLGASFKSFATSASGIATGIGLAVTAISTIIQAYKNWEAEQARLRQQTLDTNNDIFDSIDSLEQVYVKYAGRTDLTAEEENELKTAIKNTSSALGDKVPALEAATKAQDNYAASIENTTKEQIKAAQLLAQENLDAAREQLQADSWDWLSGSEITMNLSGRTGVKEFVKAKEVLEELMGDYIDESTWGQELEPLNWDSNHKDMEAVVDYYYRLIELKNTLLEKSLEDEDYINNDIYDDAKETIDALSGSVEEYLEQQYNVAKYSYEMANGIPSTVEEYQAMKNAILANIDASEQYKAAIGNLADAEWSKIFDLSDVKNEVASSATEIAENLDISFSDLFGEDSEFESKVDDYIDKVNTLKESLTDYRNGDFSNDDLVKLIKQFPELADDTDNLDAAIVNLLGDLNSDMLSEFSTQFGNLNTDEDVAALQNFQNAVLELGSVVGNTQMSVDIEAEAEGMENLVTAMEESVSSTGLTSESIQNLKQRYQELEAKGYDIDKVFEETTNGIHLNGEALRELESAYEEYTKNAIDTDLQGLVNEYNSLTEQINNCSDATKTAELYAKRDDILNQINETATLAAQYEGLTSAYHKWEMAQAGGNERDMYEGVIKGKEEIEEEMSRGWLDDDTRAYLELLSGKDLSTAKYDELLSIYKELGKAVNSSGYSVYDFFTKNKDGDSTTDGIFNFFDAVKTEQEKLGEEWVKINEDGTYSFDFGVNGDKAVAEALGISEELVQIILRAAADAGFEVNLDSAYSELADFEDKSKEVNDRLKELGATEYTFNINSTNVDDLNTQIKEAKTALSNLKNEDGTLKVGVSEEDYKDAQTMIAALIYQKQKLDKSAILSVDTSNANSEIETTIDKLKEFKSYNNTLEVEAAVGADTTEAQTNIQTVLEDINNIPDDVKTKLGLDDTEFQTALTNLINTEIDVEAGVNLSETDLATINSTISAITPEMMVKCGLDATLIENYQAAEHTTEGTVIWDNNIDKVTAWADKSHTADGTVNWGNNIKKVKTHFSATGTVKWINGVVADGTAHSRGTAYAKGTAYSRGNWGTKESGIALGGELGQELVVRNGKFFTIGDKSAEFFKYRKGDIIFNAEQTKEIFEKGKITHGNGRGRALAEGTAFSRGSGGGRITVSGSVSTTSSGSSSDKSNGSKKSSKSSSTADEFKETLDWIEIAIDRIERAISRLDLKASSVYKSWSNRNKALKKEISAIEDEIALQQQGYDRYIQQANSVGLSSEWAEKVRNGEIDIDTITDEGLAEQIQEYQEWYEKALDCKDAIDELNESLAECYQTAFDNVVAQYDGILAVIGHEKSVLDEYIAQSEAKGYVTSTKYYDALIKNEQDNIKQLEKEKTALLSALESGMASGAIEKESEAWYEMISEIDEVTLAIEEGNTAILEYANSIREIEWGVFDLLQEQISQITAEADFLIDLMSNDKLYDDKGQLTNVGMSTMGLHGQNYNVYMAQADKYAQEILKIDKQLAKDPYNQDLLERRQELLELQQENIIAAEDEKQAIVDMVREGIELELSALDELITTYTDALDAQKDLYDYQKKIAEQTKEIATLEKQLSAYAGDTSEEARAKIQQIKVSLEDAKNNLEETQYDRYISDTKKLLDELYLEYETILNQRLDNVDVLLADMITAINTNADEINTTLSDKTESVGYTLSDSMKSIWDTNITGITTVLTTYGQGVQNGITNATTTINSTLGVINTNLKNMITQLNKIAGTKVSSASTSSAVNSSAANTNPTSKPTTTPTTPTQTTTPSNNNSSTPAKAIKVGGKINAKGAKIYDYAGDTSGERQYYRNDPIYKVLAEKSGYLKVRHHKSSSGVTGWFKKKDVKAYATGKRNFLSDEIAWTQDGGAEMIIRPSDGAILTPIARSDSILSTSASGNIWEMANNPSEFIRENLKLDDVAPVGKNAQTNYTQNFERVVFNLPNVKNYDELLSAMQHDRNFERLIMAMTIDRVAGKSPLAKGKSIR